MRARWLILLGGLLLAACAPNPYEDLLVAQARVTAQAHDTEVASAKSTLEAAKDDTAITRAERRLSVIETQSQLDSNRGTATADVNKAQSTQETATVNAYNFGIQKTADVQKAIANQQAIESRQYWGDFAKTAAILIVFCLCLGIVILAWYNRELPLRLKLWREGMQPLGGGVFRMITLVDGRECYRIIDIAKISPDENIIDAPAPVEIPAPDDVHQISPSVYSSPTPRTNIEVRNKVLQLVRDSIQVAGRDATVFPRWDKIGWSSNDHQWIMAILKAMQIVASKERSKTELIKYPSLAVFEVAIARGQEEFKTPTLPRG